MALQLRRNLHWCDCGGRAVFLDIDADRYFCLPREANDAFLRLAAQRMEPSDAGRLRMLVARQLMVEGGAGASLAPPAKISPPTHDLLGDRLERALPLRLVQALASEWLAGRALRTRSFRRLIESASRHPSRSAPANPDRSAREIVAAADALALLTRSHDRCLVRALAVHSTCRKSGLRPQLVFGVIAHPFTAHCWVQLGSAVLVGGYEQARLHTPILVVQ